MLLQIHEPGQTPLPHQQDRPVAIGIDLGTTNSVVCHVDDQGEMQVIVDQHGARLIPSVVAYDSAGQGVLVGPQAYQQIFTSPENVVVSIKRLMAGAPEDIAVIDGTASYHHDQQAGMIRLQIGQQRLTPVEISADILRYLRKMAEDALGQTVEQAVITVPAYFDETARTATKDAARLAGLTVLRLINEPTSAALAYGLDHGVEGIYAVYDLGGGTFDISLLRMEKGVFQVLASAGDTKLGGDDFDRLIFEHFMDQRRQQYPTEPNWTDAEIRAGLQISRQAKEMLTNQEQGQWCLANRGVTSQHNLTRQQFQEMTQHLVQRSLTVCQKVMIDAGLTQSDVRGVVLVGGSTRIPHVVSGVAKLFQQTPLNNINPDEVVAVGAAYQAQALTVGSDTLLLDVLPLSLGIETMGGIVEKIVERNTPIPVAKAQEFTTYQDGQTAMALHVVQGERELAQDCRSLARFELRGIPPMVAGAAKIRVQFTVDADGLLVVSAEELSTGIVQHVMVKPSYGLSEDEMARMLLDSMKHGQQDMERRLLIEAQVDAQRFLTALAQAMLQDDELLDLTEKQQLTGRMIEIRQNLERWSRQELQGYIQNLEQLATPFAQKRMDKAVQQALVGKNIDNDDQIGRVSRS